MDHEAGSGRPSRRRAVRLGAVAGSTAVALCLGGGLGATAAVPSAGAAGATAGMTGMTGMAMASTGSTSRLDATCPAPASPPLTPYAQPLPVPARIDLTGATTTAALDMRTGQHRFSPDLPATPTLGYAVAGAPSTDVYGGPTIEARKGRAGQRARHEPPRRPPARPRHGLDLHGHDRPDATAPRGVIHLHGAHSEPSQDGLPQATVASGQSTSYRYSNDQDAAGLWYHDHSWGMTRLQVSAGLAGQYWLRDAYDTGRPGNPLGLPTGANEIPLTLQDRTFNADGTFAYAVGAFCGKDAPAGYPNQWAPESFGDVAVVNGAVAPNLDVSRGAYRFRVLNASNAQVLPHQASHGGSRLPDRHGRRPAQRSRTAQGAAARAGGAR